MKCSLSTQRSWVQVQWWAMFFFTSFNIHNAANYAVCSKIINSTLYIIIMHMYIILFTSDPTLTPENVLAELQEVQLWGRDESSRYLDMPCSTHDNLIRRHGDGAQGKSALVNEYLSQHPYPRWSQIVDLLEERERIWMARAGLAQEVKDKYITSEYTILYLMCSHFSLLLSLSLIVDMQ